MIKTKKKLNIVNSFFLLLIINIWSLFINVIQNQLLATLYTKNNLIALC